ncbi:MAG: PAS domain-containing protein [Psychrobacter sp.]|jgi:aerotaxis receptor|uniref:PAS domain-containing protein n=1 Tax=Psychrobacter TaxID=497 RepID=UPI0004188FAF|nr:MULTISPECIES: PAS domain-containing protein [Psychrobacter]HAM61276.1 PAS domain S-box protein [Psychrobacter sp.]|tara:strand:- start:717 stop:1211 length:495 start_codon:yes stop_codon:yes gene_type:complete
MVASLPDATKPDATAEPITMTYHDGASRIIYDTGIERPYPDGKLIVSRTDLAGNITHVNDAFVEISGYDIDELIGKPHYILRHPDMPKAAYKDLWSTAEAGQKWHGYVKNLCKDGSHYWVYATVVPNVRRGETVGYTSVRRKPSRSKIADATTQYAQMKQDEEG